MCKRLRTVFFTSVMTFVTLFASHALPGVTQYIPDNSGEYVFYRDSSFKNDTFVGFLFYNESTYAARIYSPANSKSKSMEKNITVYVNVDPSKSNLTLTGEKIDGTVEGNAEYVNYLHDMLYEFAKRRQAVTLSSVEPKIVDEDFNQFGGSVKVKYNSIVPVFNIEEICGIDGKPVFQIVTAGLLSDSGDTSFVEFKGVSGLPKDKKRVFKKDKHSSEVEVNGGNQKLVLDTQWQQSMQNLWLLGDYAILSINEMALPSGITSDHAYDILVRRFCQSTTHSYSVWQQGKVTRTPNNVTIMNVFYQPESENVTRDFKIITKKSDGNFALLTFTVFDSVYQKSRFYFDTILKSYVVE